MLRFSLFRSRAFFLLKRERQSASVMSIGNKVQVYDDEVITSDPSVALTEVYGLQAAGSNESDEIIVKSQ